MLVWLCFCLGSFSAYGKPALVIFVSSDGAPKHYSDLHGNVKGYAVDIAKRVVERAGFTPEVRALPWKRAQSEAAQGKGIITGFSKTPERESHFWFSGPLYDDRVLLVMTRQNAFAFESFDDLYTKRIGIPRGSYYSGPFDQVRDQLLLEEDSSHLQRLKRLLAGRIDAAIFSGDVYTIDYNASQLGVDRSKLIIAEKAISYDPNYLGVPKVLQQHDGRTVHQRLSAAIEAMHVDGSIRLILEGWTKNMALDQQ